MLGILIMTSIKCSESEHFTLSILRISVNEEIGLDFCRSNLRQLPRPLTHIMLDLMKLEAEGLATDLADGSEKDLFY
ncbi:MAG: hypothetical protein DRN61_06105 [Thaumarchaeota archaeon]|nr:MAG: hypothetical protein DRN61_06105 [Nitrososphaerota archaeon]